MYLQRALFEWSYLLGFICYENELSSVIAQTVTLEYSFHLSGHTFRFRLQELMNSLQ